MAAIIDLPSSTTTLMLILKEIKKDYNGTPVLDIPRCSLDHGTYWITGSNGSGKTTLLKIIAGAVPFSGEVVLNGISLKKRPVDFRKTVSFAEARPVYPSFLKGSELVNFFTATRKAAKPDLENLIHFSGLKEILEQPVGTYSSGMLKRLSLLLAFIGNCPSILLDEPLATLDAEGIEKFPRLIQSYREQFGTSFLITSHQQLLHDTIPDIKEIRVQNLNLHFNV